MHGGTLLCMWMYTEEEHHCYLVASLATFQLEEVSYSHNSYQENIYQEIKSIELSRPICCYNNSPAQMGKKLHALLSRVDPRSYSLIERAATGRVR